jgi:hypothetical protein
MDANRKEDGLFQFVDTQNSQNIKYIPISEQYFSLLKFSAPDETLDPLECLAATVAPNLKYMKIFPISCNSEISTAYVCITDFSQEIPYQEQTDVWMELAYSDENNPKFVSKKNKYLRTTNRLNFLAAYQSLFHLLWQTNLPCFEIPGVTSTSNAERSLLKYCEWKGVAVPCSAIFSSFPTDTGMCCSFNMKAAEEMFAGQTFPKLLRSMQALDKRNTLTDQEENDKVKILDKTQPGRQGGLTVIVDTHKNSLSAASLSNDTDGIIGMIRPSGSYPNSNLGSFDIKTGYTTLIALSGTVTSTSDEFIGMDTQQRKCLFAQENINMTIFQLYSQSNCFFECFLSITKGYMKEKYNQPDACIPWSYPSADLFPKICNPWEAVEFQEMISNIPTSKCSHCLPDCSSVTYSMRVSSSPIRACELSNLGISQLCNLTNKLLPDPKLYYKSVYKNYMKRFKQSPSFLENNFVSSIRTNGQSLLNGDILQRRISYDAYENDFAKIQVYFKQPIAQNIERKPTMTWLDYCSGLGGIMGLVLGMGIISLFEATWLCYRIVRQLYVIQEEIL